VSSPRRLRRTSEGGSRGALTAPWCAFCAPQDATAGGVAAAVQPVHRLHAHGRRAQAGRGAVLPRGGQRDQLQGAAGDPPSQPPVHPPTPLSARPLSRLPTPPLSTCMHSPLRLGRTPWDVLSAVFGAAMGLASVVSSAPSQCVHVACGHGPASRAAAAPCALCLHAALRQPRARTAKGGQHRLHAHHEQDRVRPAPAARVRRGPHAPGVRPAQAVRVGCASAPEREGEGCGWVVLVCTSMVQVL